MSGDDAEDRRDGTVEDGIPFDAWPLLQRFAILVRMMGVALAHEMAHYLLDTARHSSVGLLQAGLNIRELAFSEPTHLKLTPAQQRLLASCCVR